MAINTSFFSSKELSVGVGIDNAAVGTAATSYESNESESLSHPTFNDVKIEVELIKITLFNDAFSQAFIIGIANPKPKEAILIKQSNFFNIFRFSLIWYRSK